MSELIRRILVVDDDRHKRANYVTTILEDEKRGPIRPTVSIARNVDEGLKALRDARQRGEQFHVLVTDLYVPDYKDGLWLIGKLREMGHTPDDLDVVLLSAQMAANGEVILTSERYKAKDSAHNGIASVKTNAPLDERYVRRVSTTDQPYFVLQAANGEVIGRSEMYSSKDAMEGGIASVKKNAPAAGVKDLT